MTTVEWVYESRDDAGRKARRAAMDYADDFVRGRVAPKMSYTPLEVEAIIRRRAEVTWSDVRPNKPAMVVQVKPFQIYWAVLLAHLTVGILAAFLYAAGK